MLRIFSAALILASLYTPAEARELRWGLGMGFEGRLEREVNPDYVEGNAFGQLYGQALFWPWGISLELGQSSRETRSGAFSVQSESTTVAAWGRYVLVDPERWAPYVTSGLGAHFDQVTSRFASARDERRGTRGLFGLGAGASKTFWKYLSLEAEGRVVLVQDRRDPAMSGILRVGVQI